MLLKCKFTTRNSIQLVWIPTKRHGLRTLRTYDGFGRIADDEYSVRAEFIEEISALKLLLFRNKRILYIAHHLLHILYLIFYAYL